MDSSSSTTSSRSPVQKDLSKASSETAHSPSSIDNRLRDGLANLADQNLGTAIALLTAVLDENPAPASDRRARVGLVKAYQRQGDLNNAIACCRPLLDTAHEPTRRWGQRALAALHQLARDSGDEVTGFVPLAAEARRRSAAPESAPQVEPSSVTTPVSQPLPDETGRIPVIKAPLDEPQPPTALPQQSKFTGRPNPSGLPWRRGGRAQRWTPQPASSKFEQVVVSTWTVGSLVALISSLLQLTMALGNPVRRFVERFVFVNRWRFLEEHPTTVVMFGVLLLWALSPWILQSILQRQGARRLTLDRLCQISPTAGRLVRGWPLPPRLHLLPIRAPIVLSFGLHPRLSWLVVSDGLRQMDEDEVTVLLAAELAHLQSPATACFSLVVAASQIPYVLYWGIAAWGDRQSVALLRGMATALSSLCYGLFWLFRWPTVWLSRWRLWRSDRLAVNQTGHPNGLARALVTLSAAIATEHRRDPILSVFLHGFAPLLPVSLETALPLEYLARRPLTEAEFYSALHHRLQWPCPTQYRRWLILNRTHPPLDERLRSLMATATQWRLEPEIPQLDRPDKAVSRSQMLLQTAPYWGPLMGAGLALILWSIGGIAGRQSPLGWLWGDRAILYGLTAMGASMGLLARINRYFPDSAAAVAPESAELSMPWSTVAAPVQAVPVTLRGRLLGRRGLRNALSQDLLIDTREGLVRVSFTSTLGPIGNLILGYAPHRLLGRTVTVTGWLHRGATAWIDASRISAEGKPTCVANHPVWSTVAASGLALWGAWTIYWGGA